MVTPRLAATGVCKAYGSRVVLDDASLTVAAGELVVLHGRNGTGKSVLVSLLGGFVPPDAGHVSIDGGPVHRFAPHRFARRGVFHLPPGSLLCPSLTLDQHFRLFTDESDRIDAVAESLGLHAHLSHPARHLSGGERRKAEIALAALTRSPILLADEPLRGVEPIDMEQVVAVLRSIADDGAAVLVASVDPGAFGDIADRVMELASGRIREVSAPHRSYGRSRTAGNRVSASQRAFRDSASNTETPPIRLDLDRETLRDLDMVRDASNGRSVLDVVDRTRTRGGRIRLRARLTSPLADTEQIRAVQTAVRFAVDNVSFHELLPGDDLLDPVLAYLDSNLAPARPGGFLRSAAEYVLYRLRYKRHLDAMRDGIQVTTRLVRRLEEWAGRLRAFDEPQEIRRWSSRIRAWLETPELRMLQARAGSGLEVLKVDRELRGPLAAGLRDLVDCVHQLDALASMGRATAELGFSLPEVWEGDEPKLEIEDAVHPLVARPAPNDFRLEPGERLVFLTGPNMAGKTTYMKACAMCVLLAQTGMGVPAQRMRWSPFGALLASFNPRDDVRLGYSYFLAEVRRVRVALELLESGRRTLLLLDEPFRGTNVHDALDASRVLADGLAAARSGIVVFSSHLVELAESLDESGSVAFRRLEATMAGDEPAFDHRLREGVSDQRLGMVLLQREGVLDAIRRLGGERPDG